MGIVLQIMMGVSLAACAGLRAWMPLFAVSLLAHFGKLPLNDSFAFLARTDLLIVCGIATLLELLGDKFVVVDNVLDTVGTFVRPIAGTLLAASVITQQDPLMSTLIGLILGGGTALTVHAGKAAARAAATTLSPVHGGTVNATMSVGEDVFSLLTTGLAFLLPVLTFAFAVGLVILAIKLRSSAKRQRQRILERLGFAKELSPGTK